MTRLSLLFMAAIALLPRHASADKNITMPATTNGSTVFIGMVSGGAWMLEIGGAQACKWWFLGNGGLDDNYNIQLPGGSDSLDATDNTFLIACGGQGPWMIGPLVSNGRVLRINGGNGHDDMQLGTTVGTFSRLDGGAGADTLSLLKTGTAVGGLHNDTFYGDSGGNSYYGNDNQDIFCVHRTAQVHFIDGGNHTDFACGSALLGINNVENFSCDFCGPGF
jgi:hypothetical protein